MHHIYNQWQNWKRAFWALTACLDSSDACLPFKVITVLVSICNCFLSICLNELYAFFERNWSNSFLPSKLEHSRNHLVVFACLSVSLLKYVLPCLLLTASIHMSLLYLEPATDYSIVPGLLVPELPQLPDSHRPSVDILDVPESTNVKM